MATIIKRHLKKGVRASLFQDPGIWKFPAKVCYWILVDPFGVPVGFSRSSLLAWMPQNLRVCSGLIGRRTKNASLTSQRTSTA
ncbi:hypothetical protein PF003_g20838 [Phytophthora fragariae]|nr:hypothetical protein PF003_g20838 [Phytophthora fragariae]